MSTGRQMEILGHRYEVSQELIEGTLVMKVARTNLRTGLRVINVFSPAPDAAERMLRFKAGLASLLVEAAQRQTGGQR